MTRSDAVPIKRSVAILVLALSIGLAGCSKKKPEDFPPPPMGADGSGGMQGGSGMDGAGSGAGVGSAGLPGSRADFLASVPSERILFETDSFSVDAQDRVILDAQAAWLQRHPAVRVTIEGHADERGTREYNLALGDRRANAAKNYLAGRGISPARMNVISWGKERPAALGSDEGSWAQNRRAVTVLPD
jgi:peptidoglycan-associated lipoprotein